MKSNKHLSEITETEQGLDSRLRGNDESIRTETCTTSFPRTYIPSFPQGQKTKNRNLKSRHSRLI
ncbi:hypothetical protein NM2001213_1396 [Neisseria meningitidis 2001213]|nr:hypothetical protein NM2001213_1396 [Neisseria meningitidis 2001213]